MTSLSVLPIRNDPEMAVKINFVISKFNKLLPGIKLLIYEIILRHNFDAESVLVGKILLELLCSDVEDLKQFFAKQFPLKTFSISLILLDEDKIVKCSVEYFRRMLCKTVKGEVEIEQIDLSS